MKINKFKGKWEPNSTLLDNYAYQLFINEYSEAVMSQKTFIDYSNNSKITINNKNISEYYDAAFKIVRLEKLEKINYYEENK